VDRRDHAHDGRPYEPGFCFEPGAFFRLARLFLARCLSFFQRTVGLEPRPTAPL
jgi:hypothetical protein